MMHSASIKGGADVAQIDAFLVSTRGLFEAIDHLAEFEHCCVKDNLIALGLMPADGPVDLDRYVAAARSLPLDKAAAYHRLADHFRVGG